MQLTPQEMLFIQSFRKMSEAKQAFLSRLFEKTARFNLFADVDDPKEIVAQIQAMMKEEGIE